ncbi:MAG TPA: hypothetical protein ENG52_04235 [Nitrososphaeria archaeon]|nr:hypothetical protein [Nitrososphaeria archaeon]
MTIRIRRLPDGKYIWSIELSTPVLDPQLVEELVSNVDLRLRKRYLGEDVEVPEPPKTEERKEERIGRTIPLESRNKRLFGRLIIYEDKIVLEPLPTTDPAIGWLIGYIEGKYGKERVSLEGDRTGYFRRVVVSEKPSEEELEDLRGKATWAFIRAVTRRPYRKRVWRRWR